MNRSVVFTGGGTGGHIYPAVALAEALPERLRPVFIGASGHMEETIIPEHGIALHTLRVTGIWGRGPMAKAKSLMRAVGSVRTARALLSGTGTLAVIGTGGYVAGPVGIAAWSLGVPLYILEPNAALGLTNRLLSRFAQKIFVAYPDVARSLPAKVQSRVVLSGMPVRPSILEAERSRARMHFELGDKPMVLIVGGSLGAEAMNDAAAGLAGEEGFDVVWGTGKRFFKRYRHLNRKGFTVVPFVDMPKALAACDVVVGRAGALFIAEVTARGVPALLIPSPNVAENHQEKNARALESAGAAAVLEEKDLTPTRLLQAVRELLQNEVGRRSMARAASALGRPDAVQTILKSCGLLEAETL